MLTGIVMTLLYGLDTVFGIWLAYGWGMTDRLAFSLCMLLFHIMLSALLARGLARFFPVENGRHSFQSVQYDRWRAQGVVALASSLLFDQFVPVFLKANWYRLFGARLGRGVIVVGRIVDPALVVMKQGSHLGVDGILLGHAIAPNHIVIGTVRVQPHAMIGARALVMPNVEIGEGAIVGACALVTSGKKIGPGETWTGIPAAKQAPREPRMPVLDTRHAGRHTWDMPNARARSAYFSLSHANVSPEPADTL